MTKEEIIDNIIYRQTDGEEYACLKKEDCMNAMQDYADQETERLKAELNEVKKQYSELCDVQKKLCEQNINLESEINELKEKYDNAIKTVKALSKENNEIKEKHKRDVEDAFVNGVGNCCGVPDIKDIDDAKKYYKQKFEK